VKPIYVVAADAGREISAHPLHVETHCRNFVMIENNFRLRLIDFRVDVAKLENMGLHRFLKDLAGEFENAFLIGGGCDHETDGKIIRAGKGRGHDRKHLYTWN